MLLTRRAEFSASHRCYNPDLTEERNRDLYGEHAGTLGHGHNYIVEVTMEGDPDPVTGMVVDLKLLKDVLEKEVISVMDHRHLNHEVEPFSTTIPTTENVARDLWRRLKGPLTFGNARLHSIRLFETEDLYVDYAGEEG